jgi:single-strand DNA-binding protein
MLKAHLLGNLGSDPELRYSTSGRALLRFSVAANYRTRAPEGEWQDRTEWVRVTVFGNRAETLSQYLRKGSRVYVEGRLEARPWTDQQGQLRAGLEVLATEIQFMNARQLDDDSQPVAASAIDERPRRVPESSAAGVGRRGGAAVADDGDLENLPF